MENGRNWALCFSGPRRARKAADAPHPLIVSRRANPSWTGLSSALSGDSCDTVDS